MVIETNMIELVKSPSTRVLSKGRLALWLLALLVFAALVFAVGAQAQGTNASETPIGEAATKNGAPPEEVSSVVEQAPTAVEQTPPPVEESLPPVEQAPVVEQAPPAVEEAPPVAEQAPIPAEQTPSAVEESPAPVEQAPVVEQAPPVVEQAPPVAEQAPPPVEQTPPVAEKTPPPVEEASPVAEKKTAEQTAGEVAAEAGSEATPRSGEASQVPVGASGLTRKDTTGEVAPEISIAVTTSVVPAAASEISMSPVQPQSPRNLRPQTISARGAGQMSCVRASITAGYPGGWLDISLASSLSDVPFITADVSSTAIASGTPAGSLGNGSTVENHPSSPGSGFAGGGGGSAAGGGSGSASSASSTLVDVLLQAAPRAMRRLRLAQPSWRTSFFVLIPERPD
jgi:hypothetical protein